MSEVTDMVMPMLRKIQSDIAELKEEVANNSVQLTALGQQVAGLTTAVYSGRSEISDLKRRVERIERRLELLDEQP